jgi:hypothetical protein
LRRHSEKRLMPGARLDVWDSRMRLWRNRYKMWKWTKCVCRVTNKAQTLLLRDCRLNSMGNKTISNFYSEARRSLKNWSKRPKMKL